MAAQPLMAAVTVKLATSNSAPMTASSRLDPRRRIHPSPVRKTLADDGVIVADDGRQRANRQNDRQRRITGRQERKPDHVSFARSPIPVEQSRRPFPVQVAWTMNSG